MKVKWCWRKSNHLPQKTNVHELEAKSFLALVKTEPIYADVGLLCANSSWLVHQVKQKL